MKKIISVVLAICLVALNFAGCSSKKEDVNESKLDIKYTYDSIYSDFDESSVRAFNDVCDAIVNYETDVQFNIAMLDDVLQLVYTSFPLNFLTQSIVENDDGTGVVISFKYDEEKHNEQAKLFNDKIVEIEKECGLGKVNNGVYILNAYNYVASNMKINSSGTSTLFETVMNGEGTIFTYANLFEYLLLQKDIMAFHIIAEDATGGGWSLSSAQLNDEIYYFDMATEFYSNGGKGINYFAMNSKDVKAEGLKNLKYTSSGEGYKASSKAFDACRIAKEWSLEGNSINITQYDLEKTTIELK